MTVNSCAKLAVFLAATGVVTVLSGTLAAQEEAEPSAFVSLRFDGGCDDKNNRLWLTNTHTFKTIITRVRWRAAGGKDLTEQFYPGPESTREIGCAAEAEILEAQFADF